MFSRRHFFRLILVALGLRKLSPAMRYHIKKGQPRMAFLNTKYVETYFSTMPKFQFGFTGYKDISAAALSQPMPFSNHNAE